MIFACAYSPAGDGMLINGSRPASKILLNAAHAVQVNVGKGGSWLFPYLLAKFKLQPSHTAVVGDRLDTDIAMGKQGGLVTLLPLTGEQTPQHLFHARVPRSVPDRVH
jgi:ribonucleotide monophosphatase NagD (HAD superfamily)